MRRRTLLAGTVLGAVAGPVLGAGGARAADPGPSVTRIGSSRLDAQALFFVSYDGLVNNNSFQKNGLFTYKGYQYAAWYTADRNAVVGRRALGASTWSTVKVGRRLENRRPTAPQHGLAQRRLHPQFISTPEGRLQLSYRVGISGNGRNALAEYDGTRLDQPRRVDQLHRHLRQRARLQHGPSLLPGAGGALADEEGTAVVECCSCRWARR
jgi:hypothetical protein